MSITAERYTAAAQSSSLRVQEHVRGDADYLIAMGWCKSRFGAALMRLRAEWDGAERWGVRIPVKPTQRAIMTEAQVTISKGVRKITRQSMDASRKKLEKRYESEMKRAIAGLKTWPEAILDLKIKLSMDGRDACAAEQLMLYWLDPICQVCNGTGVQPNSERGCGKCREHPGLMPPPLGQAGKSVLNFMDDCTGDAAGQTKKYCVI